MIRLENKTVNLIHAEMQNIPTEYQKPFNSMHEGLGVLREEYLELEHEIFFGFKETVKRYDFIGQPNLKERKMISDEHKDKVRKEAVQVAAMACRIIQELT